jgi:cytochrome P450
VNAVTALPRPPGPRGLPLIGRPIIRRDDISGVFALAGEFGPIAALRVWGIPYLLVSDAEAVEHVLVRNHANYDKRLFDYRVLKRLLGEGLLTADGESWKRGRRLLQPVFHRARVDALAGMIAAQTDAMLDEWRRDGRERIDVAAEAMRLTLTIVGRALFGQDVSEAAPIVAAALAVITEELENYFMLLLPPWVPTRTRRRLDAASAELERVVADIIAQRMREGGPPGEDVLGTLLETYAAEGEAPDPARLRDEVLTLLLAGHETTANAIGWTWHLLARNEDAAARLRADLRGAAPDSAIAERVPYLRMVVEEAMRLYPPVPAIARRAIADDVLGGYHVKAGTAVLLLQSATHRNPAYWRDPHRFDPLRFTAEEVRKRPKFAYFPFAAGPRICIGGHFAMLETMLAVARMAGRVRLHPLGPAEPPVAAAITLRPREGLPMRVEWL